MKRWLTNSFNSADEQWTYIKFSLLIIWLSNMVDMTLCCSQCPFPVGICKLYHFNELFSPLGRVLLIGLLLILSALYLFEKKMLFTTFLMFGLALIIISHHESNGIFYRATPLTTIFGAQFAAYLVARINKQFDLPYSRVQYSIQIIAATYTLAGISKLSTSGIGWIDSGELFSIQALKNYSFIYFTNGDRTYLEQGYGIAKAMLDQKGLIKFLLTTSLILELFCFASVFNARFRALYGIGLLLMHIGIRIVMGIMIGVVAFPMAIFYLNPLYWIKTQFVKIKRGFSVTKRTQNLSSWRPD